MELTYAPPRVRAWSIFEITEVDNRADRAEMVDEACGNLLEELLEAYMEGDDPSCVPEVIEIILKLPKNGAHEQLVKAILNKLRALASSRHGCDEKLDSWCCEAYEQWIGRSHQLLDHQEEEHPEKNSSSGLRAGDLNGAE